MNEKILRIDKKKFRYKTFNIKYLTSLICSNNKFIITGGSSIDYFLKKILNKNLNGNEIKENKQFYLSDERMHSKLKESNSYKINKIFNKLPKSYKFYKINNNPINLKNEVQRYNKVLPKKIDVAFLSLGHDYHLASLIKNMKVYYREKNVILISSLKFQYKRISISKHFISKANKIFLFINGTKRLKEFRYMVKNKILNQYINLNNQKKITLVLRNIKNLNV